MNNKILKIASIVLLILVCTVLSGTKVLAESIYATNNKDVTLWEYHPNTNYNNDHLTLRLDDYGSSRNDFVMEWTLPSNPGGVITKITLHLWLYECSTEGAGGYSVGELHELLESIQSENGATWNSRGTDPWTNPGAWQPTSADPTVVDRVDFRVDTNRTVGWKTWVLKGEGAENPVSWDWGETHSFVIYDSRNIADGRSCRFYSKEAADPTKRPYLEIEYEYIDCGLRYYDGSSIIKIACESGTLNSPLRIAKNGTIYGIVLVDTTHPAASSIRIKTNSGIKALRKLE